MRVTKKIICYMIIVLSLIINSGFGQFRIVHITDLHISDGDSYVNNSDIDGVIFSAMKQHITNMQPAPDMVIASGDISNVGDQGDGMYTLLTQQLHPQQLSNPANGAYHINAAQTIPVYFAPGNHDYYMLPGISGTSLDNYIENLAPGGDYTMMHQNTLLVFLDSGWDSFRPLWEDWNVNSPEGSGLSDGQMNWLRNILATYTAEHKIIVMHHPAVNALGTNPDGSPATATILDPADGCIISNRSTLMNICDSNDVDIVLTGHTHRNLVADREANVVDENWTGGTRYIQTAASLYRGYRVIRVENDFVWVDLPQQMPAVGIDEQGSPEETTAQAFCDPGSGNITVTLSGIKENPVTAIRILDVSGKTLWQDNFTGTLYQTRNLQLSSGLYLVALENAGGSFVCKLGVY